MIDHRLNNVSCHNSCMIIREECNAPIATSKGSQTTNLLVVVADHRSDAKDDAIPLLPLLLPFLLRGDLARLVDHQWADVTQ